VADVDERASMQPSQIRITVIIQNRYTLDSREATGNEIKETANIPADFSLHRRVRGGTESIPDEERVQVHNGDHFFAQPRSQPSVGHNDEP
jgi:hypothetical protein